MIQSFATHNSFFSKIRWEDRLINDDGSPTKITVDGTDFKTVEFQPFTKDRFSHKFQGPGLRYEVAIAIKTGYIVHTYGPFLPGAWPDVEIAKQRLNRLVLNAQEGYYADNGYRNQDAPVVLKQELQGRRLQKVKRALARHETINRRFKEWGILEQTYRHPEEKHGKIFRAIVTLTQLEIRGGGNVWDIE